MAYDQTITAMKKRLKHIPKFWDGKQCILELKEAYYNWKQMEWWAFYFEYKARSLLQDICVFPGDKIVNVTFDMKIEAGINFDLKAKAIKSDEHKVILNDVESMDMAIAEHGVHGEIIALCDVEYNDENRTFQKWHSKLKGGLSAYEKDRKQRTSTSRYRKTKAELCEIVFVKLKEQDLASLGRMNQGRNANGKDRPPKYMLDLERLNEYEHTMIGFN